MLADDTRDQKLAEIDTKFTEMLKKASSEMEERMLLVIN